MPELPDLEVIRINLTPRAVGRVVRGVEVRFPAFLKTTKPPPSELVGRRLVGIDRRGKFLGFKFEGVVLLVHLMRWGWIWHGSSHYAPTRATALLLSLDDGTDVRVIEPGPQKLARGWILPEGEPGPLAELGLEPLSAGLTGEAFRGLVAGRRRQVKGILTDQKLIAGIGNAYADEILFCARLSPFRYAHTLSAEETARLWRAIPETLRWAIGEIKRRLGDGLFEQEVRDFLWVHGRAGKPCRVCGTPVGEVLLGGQRTNFCPTCQGVNQPLA
ncbi:TPA: endonuclease VIII [Candidatus Acetothermia bacterium]|nr:endonuclease VIII [Candidatus Acetothermia bacterium]